MASCQQIGANRFPFLPSGLFHCAVYYVPRQGRFATRSSPKADRAAKNSSSLAGAGGYPRAAAFLPTSRGFQRYPLHWGDCVALSWCSQFGGKFHNLFVGQQETALTAKLTGSTNKDKTSCERSYVLTGRNLLTVTDSKSIANGQPVEDMKPYELKRMK
jgi:hypothetical protein